MAVWTGLNIDAIVEGVLRQLQTPAKTVPGQTVVEEVSLPAGRGQLWPAADSVLQVGLGSEVPQVAVPAVRTAQAELVPLAVAPAKVVVPPKAENQSQGESGPTRVRCDLPVITAGSLEGFLKPGLKELEVQKKAVLTPSAVELLRARRVTVIRAESAARGVPVPAATTVEGKQTPRSSQDAGAETLVIVGRNSSEIASAVAALKREFKGVRSHTGGTAEEIADEIVREVSRGGIGRAIVVAERAESIAIRANRQPAVRVIVGHTAQQLRGAVRESECNVVVVSPTGRTVFELLKLFRASLTSLATH